MSPLEVMNLFHKLTPSRKDTYKKMQQSYTAGKTKFGLFTDTEIVSDCDFKALLVPTAKGYFKGRDAREWHNEERAECMEARNLKFGTRLFGTWRNTMGVYSIDESVAPQALASLIPKDTPSEIYKNIPEWCVYVEMPKHIDFFMTQQKLVDCDGEDTDSDPFSERILGFWAMHDRVEYKGKNHLCLDIFFNTDVNKKSQLKYMTLIPTRIILSPNMSIMESLEVGYADAAEAVLRDSPVQYALSLLLWLCVEEPDITNVRSIPVSRKEISLPKYGRNKKSGTFVPPAHETRYEIAERLGDKLRGYEKEIVEASKQHASRKKPHIRRGHWNSVWTGPANNRNCKVYWQQPVFVNSK